MPNTLKLFNLSPQEEEIHRNQLQLNFDGFYDPNINQDSRIPSTVRRGVIDRTKTEIQNSEILFRSEFPTIEPSTGSINIATLKHHFEAFNVAHSHVSVFFGLANPFDSTQPNKIILYFGGVSLRNENIFEGATGSDVFPQYFSSDNLTLRSGNERTEKLGNFRCEINEQNPVLKPLGKDKLILGFYVKINKFLSYLTKIEDRNTESLSFTFGYITGHFDSPNPDWNCVHVNIRGLDADKIRYSSYNEAIGARTGPKPGSPPMGE